MKRRIILSAAVLIIAAFSGNAQSIQNTIDNAKKSLPGGGSLSNDDVVKGLKEALSVGANKSVSLLSKADGYFKNPLVFIPFPPEAQNVKDKVDALGLSEQTNKFVETLNRAAEEAAKEAAPIFINAIKGIGIDDGFAILKGGDNAATKFLWDKTLGALKIKFAPIVDAAINKVQLTKYWNPVISKYNQIPFVEKQNPDLNGYVTTKAIEGLFKLIAVEEKNIRKNPAAQVTDILKKVFGKN